MAACHRVERESTRTKLRPIALLNRLVLRVLDSAITAPARRPQSISEHLHVILGKSSNFDRVASFLNLANNILPGISNSLSCRLYNTAYLPFDRLTLDFLDYGSGGTVFLLKSNEPPKVLKVYRSSLGKSLDVLLRIIHEYRRKYAMVTSWYNAYVDLVLPSEFLILNGPIWGSPVAAALQSYIAGTKKDLLRDFTDEELLNLFGNNTYLRRQFLTFADRTITEFSTGNYCFDLVGKANLMLVENEGNCHMTIADAGVFDLQILKHESPNRFNKLERYISRLESLLKRLDGL